MTGEELRVEDEPRREDMTLLDARLYAFNTAASGVDDGRWLAVFVRDASGEIVADLLSQGAGLSVSKPRR